MAPYHNYNADRTEKLCKSCGKMLPIERFRTGKREGRKNECRPCEQEKVRKYRMETPAGVASEFVRKAKWTAKDQNVPFDLTREWVLACLQAQNWKCALTGLPMACAREHGSRRGFCWNSISMDRIRHKGGYTRDNVRFVLNAVNLFRNDGSDDRMYLIAEALVNNKVHVKPIVVECQEKGLPELTCRQACRLRDLSSGPKPYKGRVNRMADNGLIKKGYAFLNAETMITHLTEFGESQSQRATNFTPHKESQ